MFSKLKIALCRHTSSYPNSWHNLYDFKDLPKLEIAGRFNEESELLQSLGLCVKGMAEIVDCLVSDDPRKRVRRADPSAHIEWPQIHNENFNDVLQGVASVEVVSQAMLGRIVNQYCTQRAGLSIDEAISVGAY